jgi:hypothetical protein
MEGSPHQENRPGTATGARAAWQAIAALADYHATSPGGAGLAAHIARDASASQSSVAIRNLLHEILVDFRDDPDSEWIVAETSQLVLHLEPQLLSSIVRVEGEERRRNEFLTGCAARLSIEAAVRLSWAVAAASDRSYPSSVRSVVKKLAQRTLSLAGTVSSGEAEQLMREQLQRQYSAWMRPKRGTLGGFEPIVDRLERRPAGRATPDGERVVETALECDALGGAVWLALQEVVEEGGTPRVIEFIKNAPVDSMTAAAMMKRVGTPNELREMLRRDPLDGAAVDALLRGMGLAATNVMLEELVESTHRVTRRYLMDRLARFGPEIRPMVEGRLKDQRWFVQRNMLALLRNAKCPADLVLGTKFMQHKDARVRREAALWCLETPATRNEAMSLALADRDTAVMRPALQAARNHLPPGAVPVLAKRVLDSDFPPQFRVLAINLIGRSGSVLALEALLHFAQGGKTLFGKPRLAAKSQEMLAAVGSLARSWTRERRASGLLAQAAKSRDRDIQAAIKGAQEAAA